jgi:hypothetical protein
VTGDLGLQACPADLECATLLHKPVDLDKFFAAVTELGA